MGDYLIHYGVLGMKWGRRKQKTKANNIVKKNEVKKKKILTDSQKQTLKSVGKTTAKIAGGVAAAAILGSAGSMALNELNNHFNPNYYFDSDGNKQFYKNITTHKLSGSITGSDGYSRSYEDIYRYATRADGSRVLLGRIPKR